MFDGFYVLNKYNKDIFPQLDLFEKHFKQGSFICIPLDDNLTSILNRKKVVLSTIKSSPSYSGIAKISAIVSNGISITNSPFKTKRKSGFLSSLFKFKQSTVKQVNSLEGLVNEKEESTINPSKAKPVKPQKVKRSKSKKGER
jgi:hypothetical protein